ncbi:AEC family transporter [Luteolibacter flavescens]|uniref:AEC family transporter n=1 Tax=Luteolibacter flavescens TaxID=1859460 RepID=A0ABT3FKX8_9BACT|nr:AEC family transporter [Luteolibacter flavescens]MCW1884220.1 AEC family transporter [Luteolibacter flavescens]
MISTLLIVLPVFGLILTGWLVRRMGVLGPQAASELNRFVVYLALPALLFDIVARARPAEIWQPGFIVSFGLGCVLVFAATLWIRWRSERHLADAAIDALGSSYANTGYIGFPLALAVFGPAALAPTLIASMITVCAIFAVAIVLIEIGIQGERRPGPLLWKTGKSLAKNPLLVAPLLGAIFPLTGAQLPESAGSYLKLLGGAASPCALVSLGLFLAEKRESKREDTGAVGLLIGLKLVAQPLVTWVMAALVFKLPPALVQPAVLLAALPTGTGPFMLAEFYQREAGITSKVIICSTVLSVLTLTGYLMSGV